jgi:hypothetical protein
LKYKALSLLQNPKTMSTSRTRFVIVFLVSAFVFQFISNSLLGPEVRLFPANGNFFPGTDSPIAWKGTLATILYPVKFVLIGPLSFLGKDPDPAPPVLVITFALYWSVIALILYYLLSKIKR